MSEWVECPRILVVDDDEMFLERLRRHLRSSTCHAEFYSDPCSALKNIEDSSGLSAVFVDLNMPQMSGIQFFHRIGRSVLAPCAKRYLTSEVPLPQQEAAAMAEVGARFQEKDHLRKKAFFLDLMGAEPSMASMAIQTPASH